MDGYFNLSDEPVVELDVGSSRLEFLVDTGFNGSLIVPSQIANRLDLRFEGPEEFQSVTGEAFLADAYSVEVDWLGQKVRVAVAASKHVKESIPGGHMLKNCRLTVDYGNRIVSIVESCLVKHTWSRAGSAEYQFGLLTPG
jgi:clan AA aspartic protease